MCVQSTLHLSLERCAVLAKELGVSVPLWADPPTRRSRYRGHGNHAAGGDPGGEPWLVHLPDDGVCLSPWVEIFRKGTDYGYEFEEKPITLEAVVSVAMPNWNDRMNDAPVDGHPTPAEYHRQLERKWRAVLVAAAFYTEADTLVVPDAGCGVFMNPPAEVGAALGRVLRREFAGRFEEVVVAYPGGEAGAEFFEAALVAYEERIVPVSWSFSVRCGYELFADDCQAAVEAAFQSYQTGLGPAVCQVASTGRLITADFARMTQSVEGSDRLRGLRRRPPPAPPCVPSQHSSP